MAELQYIIHCSDKSFCIIYEHSILINKSDEILKIEDEVTFLWPEDSPKAKKYIGKIVEISENGSVLEEIMNSLVKKQVEANRKGKKKHTTEDMKLQKYPQRKNDPENLLHTEMLLKNKVTSLVEKNLFSNMEAQIKAKKCDLKEPQPSTSNHLYTNTKIDEMDWMGETIDSLITEVDFSIASLSSLTEKFESIAKTLSYLRGAIAPSKTNEVTTNRRSYGFPPPTSIEINEGEGEVFHAKDTAFDMLDDNSDPDSFRSHSPIEILSSPVSLTFSPPKRPLIIHSDSEDEGKNISSAIDKDLHLPGCSEHKKAKFTTENKKKISPNHFQQKEEPSNPQDPHGLWTLKYLEADEKKNIVELLPGSDIYVNLYQLKTTRNTCERHTTLARALLECVFKESALKKCSIAGRKANNRHGSMIDRRPGLSSKGVDAILAYARKFAKKQHGWVVKDDQTVKVSLRQKSLELSENKISIKKEK